jgi:hypothetical protein
MTYQLRGRRGTAGLRLASIIACSLLFTGCASYYGAARLQSNPPGAEVVNLEDDTALGITPVSVWWKGDSNKPKFINVRFKKPGYRSKVTAFWINLRHSSRADAEADPQTVNVQLEKENAR